MKEDITKREGETWGMDTYYFYTALSAINPQYRLRRIDQNTIRRQI